MTSLIFVLCLFIHFVLIYSYSQISIYICRSLIPYLLKFHQYILYGILVYFTFKRFIYSDTCFAFWFTVTEIVSQTMPKGKTLVAANTKIPFKDTINKNLIYNAQTTSLPQNFVSYKSSRYFIADFYYNFFSWVLV